MKIYGVIFKENGKIYNFKLDSGTCDKNINVIVETEKGLQFGKIVREVSDISNVNNIKSIVRIATDDDYDKYIQNLKESTKALKKAKELVKDLNLKMNLIECTYTFDKTQLLFNFYSEERIDFRELAKKLAALYKTRIELRQIGARDKAEEIGGIGVCGRILCCTSFLKHKESVTMNMAKNQNISLNPSKINGLCGRLLCCLAYEDKEYSCCRNKMPNLYEKISTEYGEGTVVNVNLLELNYDVKVKDTIYNIKVGCNKDVK